MSDYNFLMEIRLSPPQFQALNYISRVAAAAGMNLYLVGGAVRDLTSGHDHVRNLNFAVDGGLQKILKALQSEGGRKPPKGRPGSEFVHPSVDLERFQLNARRHAASLLFANSVEADLAVTHREVFGRPGHPPEIEPAGIFEDLRGRDFSVNAMAVSLHPNSRGLLLDPTNGALDIENREFRALHSHSFTEDPSRIYRLLRLTRRLGFKVETRTQGWLDAAIENKAWEQMAPEQQGRELRAVLQEESPGKVLRLFAENGLLPGLDRALTPAKIPFDRLEKIRSTARSVEGVDAFLLYFHDMVEKLSPAHRKRLAQKIMPDSKTLKLALGLEMEARKLAKTLVSSKAATPSFVYRLLDGRARPVLLYLLIHFPQVKIQTRLKSFLSKYPQVRARLPRAELHALGVDPGPRSEKILQELFFSILDGKIKTQPQITKALRELAGVKEPEREKPAASATSLPPPKKSKPEKAGKSRKQ